MQQWNLHRRVALTILLLMGSKPRLQIAGIMIATGFLSMWVSNTATAIMMLPIGMSVAEMLTADSTSEKDNARFMTAMLLAIAYASSIGGIATLIGTPPNVFLAGFLSKTYGIEIGFGQWMLLGALAIAQGIPPEMLAIPAAIAASCAFMMPVATPPNAIVFGTGHMKIQSMIKAGFALNIASVVIITGLCYLLIGLIWVR
ncbi:SLC13 family permease [Neopusillimonas aromaticivorans]|uniref:SLC13 family permease n=1 Tax=Neopusillimonas aromaticivorans TaxID=2979868 RepID=UPI00259A15C3|nr:SLC13 family permease [Neopusillimonas aromaticivorans]WJJ92534.1 SLC13 family permease [Neopusillimonas aromaticivorans]